MIHRVTGYVWNTIERAHITFQTFEFDNEMQARGFINCNREWIKDLEYEQVVKVIVDIFA